ncbi:MAG TPA: class I SAM-dependent methyltransferase [Bacteroidia bacterium]|nr:class I SAM-dependent methyltransferase [Bacteroidia bacterium]
MRENEIYIETQSTYNAIAGLYAEKFMRLGLYNQSYDAFCAHLKQNASVLEIGCGPGNISHYLLDKMPGLQILGIDFAENMISLARQNVPGAEFRQLDCRSVSALNTTFEAIISGFCIPYLAPDDCQKLFQDCFALLKPGGISYFSFIEDHHERSGFQYSSDKRHRTYIYYYGEEQIRSGLIRAGLIPIETFRIEYPRGEGSEIHTIYLAQKK